LQCQGEIRYVFTWSKLYATDFNPIVRKKEIMMVKAFLAISLILFLFTFCASTQADVPKGEIIFEDDFSEGTDKWIAGDKGSIREGWYHLRGEQGVLHRVAVKDSGEWTDYIVEFDLKIVNVIASWMVRCELDPTPSRSYLFCFNGREFQRNVALDKNRPAGEIIVRNPVKHGEARRITIVVKGDTIKHYIDGELVDVLTDDSLPKGGFGFRQMNAEAGAFANVKVHALPPAMADAISSSSGLIPYPVASIPLVSKPPALDGVIMENEWSEAARLAGFSDLSGKLARKQTVALVSWDSGNIYFAFQSQKKFDRNVPTLERDSNALFNKDAIEINLKPGAGEWMKLAFDHVGSQWDNRFKGNNPLNESWNPEWEVRHHIINDEFFVTDTWQAEVGIPFSSLGVKPPAPGERWSVQICRNFDDIADLGYPVGERWTSWSPATQGGFNEPTTFGAFRWVRNAPIFRLLDYRDIANGQVGFHGELIAPGSEGVLVKLRASLAGQEENLLVNRETSVDAGEAQPSVPVAMDDVLDLAEIADVVVSWEVIDSSDGSTIARAATRTECVPSFALTYAPLFTRETIVIEGDLSRMSGLPAEVALAVSIRDGAGAELSASGQKLATADQTFRIRHSLAGVPAGVHTIQVTMTGEKGRTIASSIRPLEVPAEPDWMKTDTGVLESVAAPWTPVEVEQDKKATVIKTWSKTYRYEDGMLPAQINIGGEDRLAAPAKLVLVTDQGRETVQFGAPEVSETSNLGTSLRWQGQSERFNLVNEARIEFDGLIWNETRIRPRQGAVNLREVYLEIPYRKQGLRYMRGEDSMNFMKSKAYIAMIAEGKLDRDYPLPDENPNFSVNGWPWQDRFINFYWTGGVDFGLFTVVPSMRNMHIAKTYNELVEEEDRCLFRLYFIDQPTQISGEIHYAYGLQGTPTHPMRNRSQMNRTGYHGIHKMTWDYFMYEITRQWDGGVIDKFFTGPKMDAKNGDFYAKTIQGGLLVSQGNAQVNAEELQRIRQGVRAVRDLGMKPLLWLDLTYTPISLPHELPYAFEWEQYPAQRQVYGGEEHTLVCPKSRSWKNYYLGNLDRLMKEEGIAGVYLDMTGPGSCNNHYHGCGYEQGGEWKGEIAFLELRDLFLRLYNVVHSNDPDGVIFYHSNSWNPTVLYADMDTKGEGWSSAEDYRTFSLPYYQAGYMFQHQYNIAHNFFATHLYCSYRAKPERVASLAECVGLSLLHDTLPCVSTSLEIVGMLQVWNALDDFGAYDPGTKWTPYWESGLGNWQDGIAVSTYRNPAGEHFLVVFNPDFDSAHSLDLDLQDFGASSTYDIVAGTTSDDPRVQLQLPPRDLRLLRLTRR
jgi:hypothetical protein